MRFVLLSNSLFSSDIILHPQEAGSIHTCVQEKNITIYILYHDRLFELYTMAKQAGLRGAEIEYFIRSTLIKIEVDGLVCRYIGNHNWFLASQNM